MLNASMAIASYLTVLGDVGCRSFIESPLRSQNFGNRDGVLRLDELMARWLHGLGVIWLTLPTSCVGTSKGPLGERSLNPQTEVLDRLVPSRGIPRSAVGFRSRDR